MKFKAKAPLRAGFFYKSIEGEIEGTTHHSRVKDV
jgi:hypothetical protein